MHGYPTRNRADKIGGAITPHAGALEPRLTTGVIIASIYPWANNRLRRGGATCALNGKRPGRRGADSAGGQEVSLSYR